ncbi:MAG: molybdenum cofactor biosynthesis protein MoaE [Bacteroidota bacterium]
MIDIQLLDTPLSVAQCSQLVADPAAGGTVVFVGTVRNSTQARTVQRLDFEAYAPMAIKEMRKIAEETMEKYGALKCAIHHRVGSLDILEIAVIIAVATPHRKAAFAACKFAIDQLKETVPIWKKEIFADGEVWVSAHP